ncbi:MAG: hypothetical protein UU73_C0002G0087 [Candidatus Daviesbacteria bacterium GW2011_GWA1_41_61]|uniref:Phosphoribosyltransferase n=1 Tax=Candidatus Daviesbacteria bacterium GW2011_GWA2_40_9 TaxID=1618424 RepID=A0A0G0U107_9BACT|nr:MAG: hypothetical protein UU26_C0010G0008 [Candidatus Daviesbacteria bacterium GW2011_GWC1_40_9]KKR82788.1 MAG: hypothetical protein UU29_C0009G0059 [Candidatus Daviesbacteria bacterium GW2011_GWA2_40_9]KKR93747.1 MAG: hypothetical protein UU44_C0001G0087 [Candidatus Daviesbacteria bacterium GW2011_GWB1_41_15]KKS15213.1 MAG: hypothetical protein UU73_C0002G0087 [Candidatus Daviesbacteria bacterium GW2011_GWA1_41_61]
MFLVDLLFPKFCAGCGKVGTYLCNKCLWDIQQTDLVCPQCERLSVGGLTHPLCKRRYGLDGLWSLGIYQDPLRKIIQKLKYKFVKDVGETLISLTLKYWVKFTPQLLEELKKDQGEGWVVIPVPLHPKRQRFRGFNQSAQLGKLLAQKIGLDYQEVLKRIKYTKPQVGLKGKERRENLKNAFEIDPSPSLPDQDDKLCSKNYTQLVNCLLIDDVWTTGSTIKECCYVLKKAGAQKVWAITLAR